MQFFRQEYKDELRELFRQGYKAGPADMAAAQSCSSNYFRAWLAGAVAGTGASFLVARRVLRMQRVPGGSIVFGLSGMLGGYLAGLTQTKSCFRSFLALDSPMGAALRRRARTLDPEMMQGIAVQDGEPWVPERASGELAGEQGEEMAGKFPRAAPAERPMMAKVKRRADERGREQSESERLREREQEREQEKEQEQIDEEMMARGRISGKKQEQEEEYDYRKPRRRGDYLPPAKGAQRDEFDTPATSSPFPPPRRFYDEEAERENQKWK